MSSSSASSTSSSATPRRGIKLRRAAQTRFVANAVDGFRFTVTAHTAVDMPEEIFLYLRRPYNPATAEEADEFTSVCSAPDLEEYPVGEPIGTPAFFRLAEIDLVFRSQAEANDAWELIKREVEVLVNTLNLNDELTVEDDVQIGGD